MQLKHRWKNREESQSDLIVYTPEYRWTLPDLDTSMEVKYPSSISNNGPSIIVGSRRFRVNKTGAYELKTAPTGTVWVLLTDTRTNNLYCWTIHGRTSYSVEEFKALLYEEFREDLEAAFTQKSWKPTLMSFELTQNVVRRIRSYRHINEIRIDEMSYSGKLLSSKGVSPLENMKSIKSDWDNFRTYKDLPIKFAINSELRITREPGDSARPKVAYHPYANIRGMRNLECDFISASDNMDVWLFTDETTNSSYIYHVTSRSFIDLGNCNISSKELNKDITMVKENSHGVLLVHFDSLAKFLVVDTSKKVAALKLPQESIRAQELFEGCKSLEEFINACTFDLVVETRQTLNMMSPSIISVQQAKLYSSCGMLWYITVEGKEKCLFNIESVEACSEETHLDIV